MAESRAIADDNSISRTQRQGGVMEQVGGPPIGLVVGVLVGEDGTRRVVQLLLEDGHLGPVCVAWAWLGERLLPCAFGADTTAD